MSDCFLCRVTVQAFGLLREAVLGVLSVTPLQTGPLAQPATQLLSLLPCRRGSAALLAAPLALDHRPLCRFLIVISAALEVLALELPIDFLAMHCHLWRCGKTEAYLIADHFDNRNSQVATGHHDPLADFATENEHSRNSFRSNVRPDTQLGSPADQNVGLQ